MLSAWRSMCFGRFQGCQVLVCPQASKAAASSPAGENDAAQGSRPKQHGKVVHWAQNLKAGVLNVGSGPEASLQRVTRCMCIGALTSQALFQRELMQWHSATSSDHTIAHSAIRHLHRHVAPGTWRRGLVRWRGAVLRQCPSSIYRRKSLRDASPSAC